MDLQHLQLLAIRYKSCYLGIYCSDCHHISGTVLIMYASATPLLHHIDKYLLSVCCILQSLLHWNAPLDWKTRTKTYQRKVSVCRMEFTRVLTGSLRYLVKAQVIILPLLAATWIIGLFAVNNSDDVYTYVFTALVIIQVLCASTWWSQECLQIRLMQQLHKFCTLSNMGLGCTDHSIIIEFVFSGNRHFPLLHNLSSKG